MKKLSVICLLAALLSCQEDDALVYSPQVWNLSQDAFEELVTLTDTSTISSFEDFNYRMDRIQAVFAEFSDSRGAFATLYEATTRASLPGFENSIYADYDYTLSMVIDFSKRFLYALHNHLLGLPSEFHWKIYFDNAASGKSITRLIFDGINAHITIDLARSLAQTGSYKEYADDFVLIGDNIAPVVPEFLEVLQASYGVDASELFNLYFIGGIFDDIFGDGATVSFGFNIIRMEAFEYGLLLQDPDKLNGASRSLERKFHEKSSLIANIDRLGLLP